MNTNNHRQRENLVENNNFNENKTTKRGKGD